MNCQGGFTVTVVNFGGQVANRLLAKVRKLDFADLFVFRA